MFTNGFSVELVWKPTSHIAERESGDLLIPNWFWYMCSFQYAWEVGDQSW